MNALLRYAIVKSSREHLLFGLLLTPAVMIAAPMLGIGVLHALRGEPVYPFRGGNESPESTAAVLGAGAVLLSAIVSAVGAFSIFRSEVANRTAGLFFLARNPRAVSAASTIYGLLASVVSYLAARSVIVLLTGSQPPAERPELLIAVIAAMAGSALGSALVAISPETGVLVPGYVGAIFVAGRLLESPGRAAFALVLATAFVVMALTPILLRRRCAV